MIIKFTNDQEMHITVNADNSCTVKHFEYGMLLMTETYRSLNDVREEYGI